MPKYFTRFSQYVPIIFAALFLVSLPMVMGGCERDSSSDSGGQGHDPDGINWESDYQAGLQQARQNNKAVLMVFSTTWCLPCNQMKKTTYKDTEVKALVESRFIPIYLDADKETALSDKYRLEYLPTYYVLKSDGSEVGHFSGYLEAEDFLGELKESLGKF